ncbi:MAG: sugar phosphate isomerase/epimerase [Clostridia bacterium]|nr:sugar phosphate isomerase/epimerase [Clostridia bacterium]
MKKGTFYPQILEASMQENISTQKVMERLVPLGMECVDIYTGNIIEEGSKHITKLQKDFGITTSSVFHYFEFDYKKENALNLALEEVKLHLENSAEVNSPFFMPVPVIKYIHKDNFEREECAKIVLEYFAGVSRQSSKYNITTVVENFSNTMSPYSYIDDIKYILDNIPDIKYVLDTGNYWFGGTDMIEACKKFASKTVHVHMKDLAEKEDGRLDICGRRADSVAIGEGILPVFEALDIIKSNITDFSAIVEINGSENVLADMEKSFINLEKER